MTRNFSDSSFLYLRTGPRPALETHTPYTDPRWQIPSSSLEGLGVLRQTARVNSTRRGVGHLLHLKTNSIDGTRSNTLLFASGD